MKITGHKTRKKSEGVVLNWGAGGVVQRSCRCASNALMIVEMKCYFILNESNEFFLINEFKLI